MRAQRFHLSPVAVLALAAALAIPGALAAAPADSNSDGVTGSFTLGWRDVSVGGKETKYRQHVNLQEGARLFGLDLDYRPERGFADRIELRADHLGGDPFENLSLKVRRYGDYAFEYTRNRSEYFYEDLLIPPEEASVPQATGGDFHHFDFDRVRERASLDVTLDPRSKLLVAFDRFSKTGESTTTLDIQRDEFEFDQPIDETMDGISVSYTRSWDKATLLLSERIQKYDNAREIFLPGASPGENTANATVLDFYFLNQPTEIDAQRHSAQLTARPTAKLDLNFALSLEGLELDSEPTERSAGTGFNGQPFTTDLGGSFQLDRDIQIFDFDVHYLLNDRVALVGGVRHSDLDQDGFGFFGATDSFSDWSIETLSLEAGVEVAVSSDLTVTVGGRQEERDVVLAAFEDAGEVIAEDVSTDHTGFFASLGWKPTSAVKVRAEIENSSFDDVFNRTHATDRQRLRLQAQWRPESGPYVQGTYLATRTENDEQGNTNPYNADYDSLSLRAGLRRDGFEGSIGYSFVEIQRDVVRVVNNGAFIFPIFFEADSDFFDARFRWNAAQRLVLGGDLRLYENDGQFPMERDDFRIYVDYELDRGYLVHLGLRTIDYEENLRGLNDYDADIVEIGVGYRF
ncbi:MAG TPA: MtrB/PioB family outer membrane beta-barrel protein [Thermoanaerobaculia bacterium]|nr:MtrB/PioB family outer membrane beta-barrel protein [Thermoanaerobaculia bacterium]